MLVALFGSRLIACEELAGTVREFPRETAITGLIHQELLIAACRGLGIQRKGGLAGFQIVGVKPEQIPIPTGNSLFHLVLAMHHAAFNRVHLTGGIADNEGRTVVSFSLGDRLDGLSRIGAHGNLRHET